MKRTLIYLTVTLTTLVSSIGLWWTLKQDEDKRSWQLVPLETLTVAAPIDFFSPALLQNINHTLRIDLKVVEYSDEVDLERQLAQKPIDALITSSAHSNELFYRGALSRLPPSSQRNGLVDVSFRGGLGEGAELKYFIPLSWNVDGFIYSPQQIKGPIEIQDLLQPEKKFDILKLSPSSSHLTKYWLKELGILEAALSWRSSSLAELSHQIQEEQGQLKQVVLGRLSDYADLPTQGFELDFWIPSQGSLLLVHGLVLVTSKELEEAGATKRWNKIESLARHLLSPEGAQMMTQRNGQATTSSQVEELTEISSLLKPSHLKTISLKKLKISRRTHPAFQPEWQRELSSLIEDNL